MTAQEESLAVDEYVRFLRESGWTLEQIGKRIGKSAERVRQRERRKFRKQFGTAVAMADRLAAYAGEIGYEPGWPSA